MNICSRDSTRSGPFTDMGLTSLESLSRGYGALPALVGGDGLVTVAFVEPRHSAAL
jgi:hypothetical protein